MRSADLSFLLLQNGLSTEQLTLCDYNQDMLQTGIDKLVNQGFAGVPAIVADGHRLPFGDVISPSL